MVHALVASNSYLIVDSPPKLQDHCRALERRVGTALQRRKRSRHLLGYWRHLQRHFPHQGPWHSGRRWRYHPDRDLSQRARSPQGLVPNHRRVHPGEGRPALRLGGVAFLPRVDILSTVVWRACQSIEGRWLRAVTPSPACRGRALHHGVRRPLMSPGTARPVGYPGHLSLW